MNILKGNRKIKARDFFLEKDAADWNDEASNWNYQLSSCCVVDEIFGTNVCTDENDDYLNVYCDISNDYSEIGDNLTVIIEKNDTTEEALYELDEDEKKILLSMIQKNEIRRLLMETDSLPQEPSYLDLVHYLSNQIEKDSFAEKEKVQKLIGKLGEILFKYSC